MKKFYFANIILMLAFTLLLGSGVKQINAAVFTVVNTNDSGSGSLRQAILDSNVNNENDTINFDPTVFGTPQTIVLTSGQLLVEADRSTGTTKTLTINGPGANLLTLNGNNQSRVMMLSYNAIGYISGITITGGNGMSGTSSTEFNHYGGGLMVVGGYNGDGVRNLILRDSIITGNKISIHGLGGGAYLGWFGTVINTTFANNEVPAATPDGGNGSGGGVSVGTYSNIWFINSTISHNRAGMGGGLNNPGGTIYLTNSTVAFNHSSLGGGGILQTNATSTITARGYLRNTIVAKNTSGNVTGDGADARGFFSSDGYNIIGDTRGMLFYTSSNHTGNQMDVDPRLDHQLRNNGGVIPTLALRADSPALDRGSNCVLTTTASGSGGCADQNLPVITTDLRGVARPQDADGDGTATVDIGAFEALRTEVASAPAAAPDLQAANDTGASSTDNITSSSTLNFDVTGLTGGAAVELLRDGVVVATTTANGASVVLSDTNVTANGVRVYTTRQIINNVVSLQGPSVSVTIDNLAPTVTLNRAGWQADSTNAQPINYSVTFSETVAGFEPADVSLAGSTAGTSSASVAISGSGTDFTIGVINLSADGTVVASIPAGAAQDTAGNLSQASTSADNTVNYDTTRPSVTINQAAAQTDPTRNLPVNFTVEFSEPVTGFAAADISVQGASSPTITVTGSGTTYNVAVGGILSNGGFVQAGVAANAAADAAGNLSLVSTSTDNQVTVDNVSPGVTINQAAGQSDPTASLPVNFTVVFSEPVTGFDAADISFIGSTVNTTAATVSVTGSGMTYNVSVGNIMSNGGIIRASVRQSAASDALGNFNFASTSTDNQIRVDNFAPGVTINQANGQSDPSPTQPVNFTVVFSELVTGFNAADISLGGSTANVSSANVSVTGSGSVYNVAVSGMTSSGQVRASVTAGAAQDSLGNSSAASTSSDNTITVSVARPPAFDYDGDGKSDLSVFRPSDGNWYINNSSNNSLSVLQFGISGDLIAPADFDGDGKTDICVFRPSDGGWYRLNSSNNTFTPVQFGTAGDLPVPGDFDGDGKADLTVYRPSAGSWFRINSSNNQFVAAQFGIAEDKPLVGDFDGDGKSDLTVFRPSNGTWYRINSASDTFSPNQFGAAGDLPVAADYDGDGKTDLAVYRPSVGDWYIVNSSSGSLTVHHFGITEDKPSPADFDGDGKADLVVFRPSSGTWYLLRTTDGFTGFQFGANGDIPTPHAFVR